MLTLIATHIKRCSFVEEGKLRIAKHLKLSASNSYTLFSFILGFTRGGFTAGNIAKQTNAPNKRALQRVSSICHEYKYKQSPVYW